ncbi:hypothetical protein R1flu_011611 [Riccia fluitans]|uniref:Uncharacterized protein n=1 Tax=Riccia fluitans TaxID=41844 RepID=A0ABD1Z8A5_9MARC
MNAQDEETGFLLRCTDEAVSIIQALVTLLSSFYESAISSGRVGSNVMSGALTTESVEDLHRMLVELLAKLWPCDKRFVAVIGPTGCGKSTLLNVLASMTCRAGEEYRKGIKLDESRAVLRDTVMAHGLGLETTVCHDQVNRMEGNEDSQDDPGPALPSKEVINLKTLDLEAERRAMCALLGICCCKDKEAYFAKHLALYDQCPFLLQNGRMGDAGTTKVTAIQWGPKFAARVRWLDKKKLRKRWRELRSSLEKSEPSEASDKDTPLDPALLKAKESKELWESMLRVVGHQLDSNQLPTPTEQLIESTLKSLGKKVALGKTEDIETISAHGCVVDRLYVREGIRKRLSDENLGLLLEDLVIEAPIPSSEGGVSFLDVPGTNDPRFLHQRETRDAIDRTNLILLILDKSVVDAGTQKVLEDSPVLERMLLDTSERCNLVVVGIAEKRSKSSRRASEIVAEFDSNQDLKKALKRVFLNKIRNLISSRRLAAEEAKGRLHSIFEDNRFCVLPVLPLLCASLHLSASNAALHRETCESSGEPTCPLNMGGEERMRRCLETNVPQLLEMIHSVRVPSGRDKLTSFLGSALSMLNMYTQESKYDRSMVEFFVRERRHAVLVAKNPIAIEKLLPGKPVDVNDIDEQLSSCLQECILSSKDLDYIRGKIQDPSSLRASNISINQDLPPVLMRGFRPEVVGNIARKLIQPVESEASCFVGKVYAELVNSMNGETAWRENHVDQVSFECIGSCLALLQDVQTQWKHALERDLARCTCGGEDGGLQKAVRRAVRKAYDSVFKTIIVDMRKKRTKKATVDELLTYIEDFKCGEKVKKLVSLDVEEHFHDFWRILLENIMKTLGKLWSDWIRQLHSLKEIAERALNAETEDRSEKRSDEHAGQNLRVIIRSKILELDDLHKRLQGGELSVQNLKIKYGYSLLQRNPLYEHDLLHVQLPDSVSCRRRTAGEATAECSKMPEFQSNSKVTPYTPSETSVTDTSRPVRHLTIPSAVAHDIAISPGTSGDESIQSPKPKLTDRKQLRNRAIVTLDEYEAHSLQRASHLRDKKRKR